MSEKEFVDGLNFSKPHEKAPDFVLLKGGMNRERLTTFLQGKTGEWVNFDVKESKEGKIYAEVDTWKKEQVAPEQPAQDGDFIDDDIPF